MNYHPSKPCMHTSLEQKPGTCDYSTLKTAASSIRAVACEQQTVISSTSALRLALRVHRCLAVSKDAALEQLLH